MTEVYIALGSNLDNPVVQLDIAILALKQLPKTTLEAVSSYYQSGPMAGMDQPDYVNAVARIQTGLTAMALLRLLQGIERRQGRPEKHAHWSARILDLDLLLYGSRRIRQKDLTVPHYGIAERDFVVIPLYEVASKKLCIPGVGSLSALKQKYHRHQLKKIKQYV